MKKTIKLFGIIVLAAVIGFVVMGCGNPSGGGTPDPLDFSRSGTFSGPGGATSVSLGTNYSRAVLANSYTLSGEIKVGSGDPLILIGNYDPLTGYYTASAASNTTRYTIFGGDGFFTSVLSVASEETWNTSEHTITPGEVAITGTAQNSHAGAAALPAKAMGWWRTNNYLLSGQSGSAVVSPYSYLLYQPEIDEVKVALVKITTINASTYDVIVSYYHDFVSKTIFGGYRVEFTNNDTRMRVSLRIDPANDFEGSSGTGYFGDFLTVAEVEGAELSTTFDSSYFMVFTR